MGSGEYVREEHRDSSRERRKRKERDEIREERSRIRERERRIADAGVNAGKHGKSICDHDRDISEQIALGMVKVTKSSCEAMYDQRLFNQDSGIQSGLFDEYNNNLYDNPVKTQLQTKN